MKTDVVVATDDVRTVLDELNRLRGINAGLLEALKTIRNILLVSTIERISMPTLDAIITKAERDMK